jgi:hypothetical protein
VVTFTTAFDLDAVCCRAELRAEVFLRVAARDAGRCEAADFLRVAEAFFARPREAPAREAPAREAPAREAPVREAPLREAVARDAPARAVDRPEELVRFEVDAPRLLEALLRLEVDELLRLVDCLLLLLTAMHITLQSRLLSPADTLRGRAGPMAW